MTWTAGRAVVDRLIEAAHIERVPADLEIAHSLIVASRHHMDSAARIRDADQEGACQLSYDAARKACVAMLQAQGLRATSRGGHIAIRDVVEAQFGALRGGSSVRGFDRLRRKRNDLEYPSAVRPIGDEDVDDAIAVASAIVDFATKLVGRLPVY